MLGYQTLRPLLFSLSPEMAHNLATNVLAYPFWLTPYSPPESLKVRVWGINFNSPVGLAAGFDKNARLINAMAKTGFGFAEVGTLTPKPQAGNVRPRIFRLSQHEAIINRLGFNNRGVDAAVHHLAHRSQHIVVGGNIGKNKDSADALHDYRTCLRQIYPYVDYITVNISSPNTPGLRSMQHGEHLAALMEGLREQRETMIRQGALHKPILVKLAPDLSVAEMEASVEMLQKMGVDGIILTNTTLSRDGVEGSKYAAEAGGLSGKPLMKTSTAMLARVYRLTGGRVPLIGVGGVASAEDAYEKILAGASLVQLYSALVYQGLGLVKTISEQLPLLLARDGFAHVSDAVGKRAIS